MSVSLFSCKNEYAFADQYFAGYKEQKIDFLNTWIFIPEEFEKVDFEKLDSLKRNKLPIDSLSLIHLQNAKDIKIETKKQPVLFQDPVYKYRTIWFTPWNHQATINKQSINFIINNIEQSILSKNTNISYQRLEVKYMEINENKAMKAKYLIHYDKIPQYNTQYVINRKDETFDIFVRNSDPEDFQKILKSL